MSRTELGDAAIFAIESHVRSDGTPLGQAKARCVIVQAKVTSDAQQLKTPTVPAVLLSATQIARPQTPTARELKLLRDWPEFDLYKASRSKTPDLRKVDFRAGTTGTLPFGWFIAAPRLVGNAPRPNTAVWPSWWMCGQPVHNQPFDVSFGSFLRALLTGGTISGTSSIADVGAPFLMDPSSWPTGSGSHWSSICLELLRLTASSMAPQHIFTSSVAKLVSVPPIYSTFLTTSAPTLLHAHGRMLLVPHSKMIPPCDFGTRRRSTDMGG